MATKPLDGRRSQSAGAAGRDEKSQAASGPSPAEKSVKDQKSGASSDSDKAIDALNEYGGSAKFFVPSCAADLAKQVIGLHAVSPQSSPKVAEAVVGRMSAALVSMYPGDGKSQSAAAEPEPAVAIVEGGESGSRSQWVRFESVGQRDLHYLMEAFAKGRAGGAGKAGRDTLLVIERAIAQRILSGDDAPRFIRALGEKEVADLGDLKFFFMNHLSFRGAKARVLEAVTAGLTTKAQAASLLELADGIERSVDKQQAGMPGHDAALQAALAAARKTANALIAG